MNETELKVIVLDADFRKKIGTLKQIKTHGMLPTVDINGESYVIGGMVLPYSDELNDFIDKHGADKTRKFIINIENFRQYLTSPEAQTLENEFEEKFRKRFEEALTLRVDRSMPIGVILGFTCFGAAILFMLLCVIGGVINYFGGLL